MNFSYTNAVQIFFVFVTINIIGSAFGFFKAFGRKELASMQKLIFYCSIPAQMFYEIGSCTLNKETILSFAHGLLLQIILHVIAIALGVIIPSENKKVSIAKWMLLITQCEYHFYSFPIADALFETTDRIYPIFNALAQWLIAVPVTTFFAIKFIPNADDPTNGIAQPDNAAVSPSSEHFDYPTDHEENHETDHKENHETDHEENHETDRDENHETDRDENTNGGVDSDGQSRQLVDLDRDKLSTAESTDDHNLPADNPQTRAMGDTENHMDVPKRRPLYLWMIFAFADPTIVCSILGFIWNAIPIDMPDFLSSFTTDLQNAIIAAGLFTAGGLVSLHPFRLPLSYYTHAVISLVSHAVVQPFITLGIAKALGMSNTPTSLLVLSNSAPLALKSCLMSQQFGLAFSPISLAFVLSVIASLPVFMIWFAGLYETGVM